MILGTAHPVHPAPPRAVRRRSGPHPVAAGMSGSDREVPFGPGGPGTVIRALRAAMPGTVFAVHTGSGVHAEPGFPGGDTPAPTGEPVLRVLAWHPALTVQTLVAAATHVLADLGVAAADGPDGITEIRSLGPRRTASTPGITETTTRTAGSRF
jgi:hypothetical protein